MSSEFLVLIADTPDKSAAITETNLTRIYPEAEIIRVGNAKEALAQILKYLEELSLIIVNLSLPLNEGDEDRIEELERRKAETLAEMQQITDTTVTRQLRGEKPEEDDAENHLKLMGKLHEYRGKLATLYGKIGGLWLLQKLYPKDIAPSWIPTIVFPGSLGVDNAVKKLEAIFPQDAFTHMDNPQKDSGFIVVYYQPRQHWAALCARFLQKAFAFRKGTN